MNSFFVASPSFGNPMPEKHEVDSCMDTLLKTPTAIKKWITVADKYMQTKASDPEMYILPKPHSFLEPVINSFYKDPDGFLEFILNVRDQLEKQDNTWDEVQSVYRKINGRFVQKARRERAARAVAKAEDLFGETDFHSRMQWTADLEHAWANRRLEFLNGYRAKYKTERLDVDTRAEVLAEFWDAIDTEIYEGRNLPPWN